jgi:hypothetical protein
MAQVVNQPLVWYPNKTQHRSSELCYDNIYLNNDPNVANLERGTFLQIINGPDDTVQMQNGVVTACFCRHGNSCNRNVSNEPALKIQPDNGENVSQMESLLSHNYYDQRQHGSANRSVYHVHVTEASVIDWNERVILYMARHRQSNSLFGPRVLNLFRRDYRLSSLYNQHIVPILGMAPMQTPPVSMFVEGHGLIEPKIKMYPTLLGTANAMGPFNPLSQMGSLNPLSPMGSLNPLSPMGPFNPLSPMGRPLSPLGPLNSLNQFSPINRSLSPINPILSPGGMNPILSPGGMNTMLSPNGMINPGMMNPGMMNPGMMNPGMMNPTVIRTQPPPMLKRHKMQPQLPGGVGIGTTSVYAPNPYSYSPLSPLSPIMSRL